MPRRPILPTWKFFLLLVSVTQTSWNRRSIKISFEVAPDSRIIQSTEVSPLPTKLIHHMVQILFNEAAQMSPEDADVHIVLGVLYNLSR
uniref:Uncharacterized protein n=1 Tax=Aegilops tauschii subsp. strangulata TaxID=200361 RepID=A0A453N8I2_AEGTS